MTNDSGFYFDGKFVARHESEMLMMRADAKFDQIKIGDDRLSIKKRDLKSGF